MISIRNLDKADVLRVLYNAAKPQGLGYLHYTPNNMTKNEAEEYLKKGRCFDYLNGRVMKVNLTSDLVFDEQFYDRDNGLGKAFQVISILRKQKEQK